jgi:SM-20-related protein
MLLPSARLATQVVEALVGPGYVVLDNPLPDMLLQKLLAQLNHYQQQGMRPAAIGRGKDLHQNTEIRGDAIQWLSQENSVEAVFLTWMDGLRQVINRELFLGLQEYECHFAHYPPGAFYQKHLDAFKGAPGRKISTVLYLNQGWDKSAGGELLLYDKEGCVLQTITPDYGKVVIFLSEVFPHEVKPATRDRLSIAGWFKTRRDF